MELLDESTWTAALRRTGNVHGRGGSGLFGVWRCFSEWLQIEQS